MPSRYGRRRLVGGAVGALGLALTGGYGWTQYASRHRLRFRYLRARNEIDDPVTLTATALVDDNVDYERTVELEPAGEDNHVQHVAGPWLKRPREYSLVVAADAVDEELRLENRELNDRLEGQGWGSDGIDIEIRVTADRTLESRIEPAE